MTEEFDGDVLDLEAAMLTAEVTGLRYALAMARGDKAAVRALLDRRMAGHEAGLLIIAMTSTGVDLAVRGAGGDEARAAEWIGAQLAQATDEQRRDPRTHTRPFLWSLRCLDATARDDQAAALLVAQEAGHDAAGMAGLIVALADALVGIAGASTRGRARGAEHVLEERLRHLAGDAG